MVVNDVMLERTRDQRMDALKHANRVRVYRAEKKRQVQAGEEAYDFFLERGPHDPLLQSMRLEEALRNMPSIGEVMTGYILRRASISPSKTLGGLSPQAWDRLYAVLESYPSVRKRLTGARATVLP